MKKIILFLLLAFSLCSTHAQINKGQWLVGGNGSVRFLKEDAIKTSEFTIEPNGGYFFCNKLAGGLRTNLNHAVGNELDIIIATMTRYSLSPFLRYYIFSQKAVLNPFIDGGVYIGKLKQTDMSDMVYKATTYGYTATAGVAYFIKNMVALEAQLSLDKRDGKNVDFSSTLLTGRIGLQFHL
jgi:hypothetical protein